MPHSRRDLDAWSYIDIPVSGNNARAGTKRGSSKRGCKAKHNQQPSHMTSDTKESGIMTNIQRRPGDGMSWDACVLGEKESLTQQLENPQEHDNSSARPYAYMPTTCTRLVLPLAVLWILLAFAVLVFGTQSQGPYSVLHMLERAGVLQRVVQPPPPFGPLQLQPTSPTAAWVLARSPLDMRRKRPPSPTRTSAPSPYLPSPPSPLLPPPPPYTPCSWAVDMLNLATLHPPQWCASLDGDEYSCRHAYVSRADSRSYSRCAYIHAQRHCALTDEQLECPNPPPFLPLPPQPPPPPMPPPPPPPTPLPPLPPPWRLPFGSSNPIDALNARFEGGRPTDDLTTAGVLMRTFDGLEHPRRPWEPCPVGQGEFSMCSRYRDRFPSSLVWPGHTGIYGECGVVIRPSAVRVRCAYSKDGTTMSKQGDPCPFDCTRPGAKLWRCAWPPNRLQTMMENQVATPHQMRFHAPH